MKISFILLAHEPPEQLKLLIRTLLTTGSDVYLHYDAGCSSDMHAASSHWELETLSGKLYLAERVNVVWGEWSIVEATLNCIQLIREHDTDSDYFMLISGSCMPIKPIKLLKKYLEKSGKDHIEAVNAEKNQWVTQGLQKQRWSKYHFFNWRYQYFRFETSLIIQRKLKIKRVIPLQHTAHMGSQWWCLRRNTLLKVLELTDKQPILRKFYKHTWVPDELFFQTLVANLVPENEISEELLLRYKFNSWGVPRIYYEDDYPEILAENRFFIRKVSYRANTLRQKLSSIFAMEVDIFAELLDKSECERADLIERLELKKHIATNRWHSLIAHKANHYDYIHSIPNSMIIFVSEDIEAKREALAQLDRLDNMVVYCDLFDLTDVGKVDDHEGYLSVNRNTVKLFKHTWHQMLGDIAYQSPGKTLAFSLGKNFKDFLEILRWKKNLVVVYLQGDRGMLQYGNYSLEGGLGKFDNNMDYKLKPALNELLIDRNCLYYELPSYDHELLFQMVLSHHPENRKSIHKLLTKSQ